jgi:hypothetical protein
MVYPAEGSLEAIREGLLRWQQDWNLAEPKIMKTLNRLPKEPD